MNIESFKTEFDKTFSPEQVTEPDYSHWDPIVAASIDLCPDVTGMMSLKKQRLLNLAFAQLAPTEGYLEVGTYQGKSLLSAMLDNPKRTVHACDNFSQFDVNSLSITRTNLRRYGLLNDVVFYDCDFLSIYDAEHLPAPIGLYFYDGAHDDNSQYLGIKQVEPFLANEALVLVDDWRFAPDSQSYARAATLRAAEESEHDWTLLNELPARFNGDRASWWNGVGVLSFRRHVAESPTG
jgi:predicted O-methyltransferase YrrM